MILVDTAVWIDHLHATEPHLVELLEQGSVLHHPMVVGELSLGSIPNRAPFLDLIRNLPAAPQATATEVDVLVESHRLHGKGLSLVDVHLLASVLLMPGAALWTRDKRLRSTAMELGVAMTEPEGEQ